MGHPNQTGNKIAVVLVEDDTTLAGLIKESFEKRGFTIYVAHNGVEGWQLFKSAKPDICLVDIGLPRKDGFSLVEDIRLADDQVPVIFLSGRTDMEDIVKGLQLGADDYVKKPFNIEELILRVTALVRRRDTRKAPSAIGDHRIGAFLFRHTQLELRYEAETITLSQREADLLLLLLLHKNDLLERKVALIKLWGEDDAFAARSMDVYITRLRKIFKRYPRIMILNKRGRGYTLTIADR